MKKHIAFGGLLVLALTLPFMTGCQNNASTSSVSSSIPEGQTGIGSGLSKEDPLFLGNPGNYEFKVYFIEMNYLYGDSIFMEYGDVDILIDAGQVTDGPYVQKFIDEHVEDGRLDLLITTHAHSDHIGGMPVALQNVENVSMIVDFGYRRESGEGYLDYRAMRDAFVEKGAKYHSAYDSVKNLNGGQSTYYLTEDLYFDVIDTEQYRPTDEVWTSNPNLTSVTTLFHYKDFSFFTAGDLPTEGESILVKKNILKPVTLFKASHHGTNGGNTQEYLNALNPKFIGISAARAGKYSMSGTEDPKTIYNLNGVQGHPHRDAIERFYKCPQIKENLNVYWNMTAGTMCFATDGSNDVTSFTGSPTNRGYYDYEGTPVWNEELNRYEGKVTGEENLKLHQTKVFKFRGYEDLLPEGVEI